MLKEKTTLFIVIKCIISMIVAVMFLSIFVLMYSYAGIHLTNSAKSTDYKWRANEIKTTMTEGFARLRMDEKGFNNDCTPTKIDILLMGSSHMEAVQMKRNENVSGILNQELPQSTYNIGMSGHTIYRCVDNYGAAIEEFNPQKYSIIETSSVSASVPQMQSVINGTAERDPSYDSGPIYYLQLIPAFRPVYNQLENWATLKNPVGGGTAQLASELN